MRWLNHKAVKQGVTTNILSLFFKSAVVKTVAITIFFLQIKWKFKYLTNYYSFFPPQLLENTIVFYSFGHLLVSVQKSREAITLIIILFNPLGEGISTWIFLGRTVIKILWEYCLNYMPLPISFQLESDLEESKCRIFMTCKYKYPLRSVSSFREILV